MRKFSPIKSLCSNYYNKRHGQYGPVSVHVNDESVNIGGRLIIKKKKTFFTVFK